MTATKPKPKTRGITSILNTHYNNNRTDFEVDIESENLKTVMLKIGEVPQDTTQTKPLPRHKQQRLAGIPKINSRIKARFLADNPTIPKEEFKKLSDQELKEYKDKRKQFWIKNLGDKESFQQKCEEVINQNTNNLIGLKVWFERYGKARRLILKHIYQQKLCQNSGNDQYEYNCNSEEFEAQLGLKEDEKLRLKDFKKWLWENKTTTDNLGQNTIIGTDHTSSQVITNAFHNAVKEICKEETLKSKIQELKMDKLLPNLFEDVGASLLSFYKRLTKAEVDFKWIFDDTNTTKVNSSYIQSNHNTTNCVFSKISDSFIFQDAKPADKLKVKALIGLKDEYVILKKGLNKGSDNDKMKLNNENFCPQVVNIINYNLYRIEIIKQWEDISRFKKAIKNGGFIFTEEERDSVAKSLESFVSIPFDPINSYPNFDEKKNNWSSIKSQIDSLESEIAKIDPQYIIVTQTDSEGRIVSGVSIKSYSNLFTGKFDKTSEEIQESEYYVNILGKREWRTASAQAREVIWTKFKDGNKFFMWQTAEEEIIKLANESINQFESKILPSIHTTKNYWHLREYAGWIYVKLTLATTKITNAQIKAKIQKQISQLASTISGFAYNLERSGFENQSIYLSDFLQEPQTQSNNKGFKSSAYLLSNSQNKTKNNLMADLKLSVGLNFADNILSDNDGQHQALCYAFGSDAPTLSPKQDNVKGEDYQLKRTKVERQTSIYQKVKLESTKSNQEDFYFDYQKWNETEPEAYKFFTKPTQVKVNINPDNQNSFVFPLHFGKNQARKYFWNDCRKDDNDQLVHHIFDVNSRLKVSSMRLIRKFNPIRSVWEYYLSLAIYRLEKIETLRNTIDPKNTIGFDVGDNNLVDFAMVDDNGRSEELNSDKFAKHIQGHKELVSVKHDELKNLMETKNYIPADLRKKIQNRTESISRQVSGLVTKLVISNNFVDFEQGYTGNMKKEYKNIKDPKIQIIRKLQKTIVPKIVQKLKTEIPANKILNISKPYIEYSNIFGIVPTELTSQICSNCGFFHQKFGVSKLESKLSTKIDIPKLKKFIENKTYSKILDLRQFIKNNDKILDNSFEDYFSADLTNYANYHSKTTFLDEFEQWTKSQNVSLSNDILNLFDHRPKWKFSNVETFRCLDCGFVTLCDKQAGLNIARWRVYLRDKNLSNFVYSGDENSPHKSDFERWYKDKVANNWTNQLATKIPPQTEKITNKSTKPQPSRNPKRRGRA